MKITEKAQRRARVKLLAQAQSDAERQKISVTEALLRIIEIEGNSDLIIKAFAQSTASTPDKDWPDYSAA
jgi:hypothetical protein